MSLKSSITVKYSHHMYWQATTYQCLIPSVHRRNILSLICSIYCTHVPPTPCTTANVNTCKRYTNGNKRRCHKYTSCQRFTFWRGKSSPISLTVFFKYGFLSEGIKIIATDFFLLSILLQGSNMIFHALTFARSRGRFLTLPEGPGKC